MSPTLSWGIDREEIFFAFVSFHYRKWGGRAGEHARGRYSRVWEVG